MSNDRWWDQFDIYLIDPSVLEGMDWALILGSTIGTLICGGSFMYWLYKLLFQMWKIARGRASVSDTGFWMKMLLSLIIILAAMSGVWFFIMEQLIVSIEQSINGVTAWRYS